jgi:anti-sigma regulatory factor (Ser/Thr protein kinase)
MRTGAAAGHAGYFHETAFYGSDEEFLALVVPFFAEGLAAGEPVVSAFAAANQQLVRDAFADTSGVRYVGGEWQYQRPAAAIRRYREMFGEYAAQGVSQIRVAGDVPHPGVGGVWDWWARYEAAVNHAYNDFPVWGLCPYDTRSTPGHVLAEVRRTHPRFTQGANHLTNPDFGDPVEFLRQRPSTWRDPLEEIPAQAELVDPSGAEARRVLTMLANAKELTSDEFNGLLLAATEAVNNGQLHGRPPVVLRVWSAPRRVVVTVTDTGTGPTDPYAGLLPRPASPDGGLGLWMAHQLCSFVGLQREPDSFTIRIVAGDLSRLQPPAGPVTAGAGHPLLADGDPGRVR